MNFDFSEDQQDIRRAARDLLAARFRDTRVRELVEQDTDRPTYDDAVWAEVRDLGWPGIAVAEGDGGQGLGLVELCILQEELGHALAPVPFGPTALAGLVLAAAGSEEQRARWLSGLATGELTGTLGVLDPSGGAAPAVADAADADVLVLVAADGSAGRVVAAADATVESFPGLDLTRRFGAVTAAGGEDLPGDVAAGLDRARVALAAETLGVAQRAMELAVAYAKERKQFGHPIGIHQGVQHRCAQMLLECESARSAIYYAAWCADAEPESLPVAAASAHAYTADAGWSVTAASLQVHGGIGFTWEHDLQLFLKRARANASLLGSAGASRERVAELLGL